MTLAERTVTALRAVHEELAAATARLSDEQLVGPSGAPRWTVAQLLSHIASGSQLTLTTFRAGLDRTDTPGLDHNDAVKARWDRLCPQDQAAGAVTQSSAVVEFLEAVSAEQLEQVRVRPAFLPVALSLGTGAGMRLVENCLHLWDLQVTFDRDATLSSDAAGIVVEHFLGELGFFVGRISDAGAVSPACVRLGESDAAIVLGDVVRVARLGGEVTATFHGPVEAAVRLIGGRLPPDHTPRDVRVDGDVTLDDLRRVFPGY